MSDDAQLTPQTDEKKSCGLGSYVVWAFVAVMVYVLSSGPVAKFHSPRHRVLVAYAYIPLTWLYFMTPLKKPLGVYWHVWLPGEFDRNGERY
jgi:hypothetical protein